jgi:subtilase family serine protease
VLPGCSRNPNRRVVRLGTSVGWADVYPAGYHENYIDVTGLRGCFAFRHRADPENHLVESDETNNVSRIFIRLPYRGRPGRC